MAMKKNLLVSILALTCLFPSSANAQQNTVKVIFDSDMALDPEDMNALCLLHAFADAGEAEILATVASGFETNRASGAAIDVINTFYGRPDIPVGTQRINRVFHKYAIPLAVSPWTPAVRDAWPHDIPDDDRCPSAVSVYRKALAAQPDNSVTIVTTGWLTNLRDLLDSKPDAHSKLNGRELISQKVKELSTMGGAFPQGWEYNFSYAGTSRCTKYVLDNWPENVPVIISDVNIGLKIISGKVYKDELPDCPLRTGLEHAWNALSEGRPSWDETSILYAVRGLSHQGEQYWTTQSTGSLHIDDQTGITKWLQTPDKNQSYLIQSQDPQKIARLLESLILKSTKNAIENQKSDSKSE